jgi:hypothetical protein
MVVWAQVNETDRVNISDMIQSLSKVQEQRTLLTIHFTTIFDYLKVRTPRQQSRQLVPDARPTYRSPVSSPL